MKIAVLGDTHFGARNDSLHFSSYFERFYTEVFFPYLESNNILDVIQLGDVFDRRKYINFQSLKNAKRFFFDRLNEHYQSWLLIGNHDTFFKNTNDVNSLDLLLGEYHNINIVNEPTTVEFDGADLFLMPWICPENEASILEAAKQTKAQVAFGHLELAGFEMSRGQVMDHGMDPNIFDKFEHVITGHFHHMSTRRNITYTGTPYEMTWADYGDPKGFHVFDTETRTLTFIQNPFTIFRKVWYDDTDKEMLYLDTFKDSSLKDCFVKLIVTKKNNHFWFDMAVDHIEKSGAIELQVVDDHQNLNLENDDDIVNQAEDTVSILRKFVDQAEVGVSKDRLLSLLSDLYQDAMSLE